MLPHIALIPSPGMGHIIPMVQLAIVLSTHHEIFTTLILTSTTGSPPAALLSLLNNTMPSNFDYTFLPPPTGSSNNDSKAIELAEMESVLGSLPAIRSSLEGMRKSDGGSNLTAVVLDSFGIDLKDLAKELGLPAYLFFGTAAMNLLFFFNLPRIDAETPPNIINFVNLSTPIILPGCPPLKGSDFGDPFLDRNASVYQWFLNTSKKASEVDGILINTFEALEPNALKALSENPQKNLPIVYPVGPIVTKLLNDKKCDGEDCQIVEWLDTKPKSSVLLLVFGTGGTLSTNQTTELANGLDMSGKNFIWAIKKPSDSSGVTSYIGGGSKTDDDDVTKYLPEGYIDKVKGRGMILSKWVPQARILAHPSTGGFLTHCGWSSVLESITNGVPMIAWPLYAEQRTNAVEIVDGLKVAIRPQRGPDGIVGRDEVKRVAEEIIGGGANGGLEARTRATQLKDAAKIALEVGGSSFKTLVEVVARMGKV